MNLYKSDVYGVVDTFILALNNDYDGSSSQNP